MDSAAVDGGASDSSGATTPYYMNGVPATEKSVEGDPPSVSQEPAPQDTAPGGRTVHGVKWFLICAALLIIAFLYGLDATIAADIQGPVVRDFGRVDLLAWIGAGFPLGSAAVQLLNGKLYGNFNMKWCVVRTSAGSSSRIFTP